MSEILSDNALERMVEGKNEEVKDAFVVVCPYIKSIEMDRMMAQGIYISKVKQKCLKWMKENTLSAINLQLSSLTKLQK